MRLGADVDGLDAVAATMGRTGVRLESLRRELDAAAIAAGWRGVDADRFRDQWRRQLGPATGRAAAAVAAAAADARRQSASQRAAAGATSLGPPPAVSVTAVPPAPVSTRLATVEIEASAGFGEVGGAVHLRIDDLGHGRSRIVEMDTVAAGVGIGGDVVVSLGDDGDGAVGGGAVASMMASVGVDRSWVVPTDEVDAFLLSRVLDPAGTTGRSGVGSLAAAVPGAGWVAGGLGVSDEFEALTYERPAPEQIGLVGGSALDAGGSAGGGVPAGLTAALASGVLLGVGYRPDDGSVLLRLSSDWAGRASVTAGDRSSQSDVDGSGTVTLTLDRDRRPVELATERVSVDGDRVERAHLVIDLTRPELVAPARRLVDSLVEIGDGPGSVTDVGDALGDLVAVGAASGGTRTDVYTIGDRRRYGVETPVAGVTVTTEELRLRR